MNAYHSQYLNNQIITASPEQILIMLYDGAIRFTKLSKIAIENDDLATKGKFVGKAMAIISEFANSLDHEIGGQIATDLDALYLYMLKELSKANIDNDTAPLDIVIDMLQGLRDTWAEAIEINNRQTKSAPYAAENAPQPTLNASIA